MLAFFLLLLVSTVNTYPNEIIPFELNKFEGHTWSILRKNCISSFQLHQLEFNCFCKPKFPFLQSKWIGISLIWKNWNSFEVEKAISIITMKLSLVCNEKSYIIPEGITIIGSSFYSDIYVRNSTPIHLVIYVRNNTIEATARGSTHINGILMRKEAKLCWRRIADKKEKINSFTLWPSNWTVLFSILLRFNFAISTGYGTSIEFLLGVFRLQLKQFVSFFLLIRTARVLFFFVHWDNNQ